MRGGLWVDRSGLRCIYQENTMTIPMPSASVNSKITVFRNIGGAALSKRIFVDDTGRMQKVAAAEMVEGTFETIELSDIAAFAEIINSGRFGTSCAACYGVAAQQSGNVASEKRIAAGLIGALARNNKNFTWNSGPGVFFGDLDPIAAADASADDYDALLCAAFPPLAGVKRFYVPSASSRIFDTRTQAWVSERTSFHLHFIVDDAAQIPAIGNAMAVSLIEAGHGRIMFAKNGARLLRTVVDMAVWQPNRLDFAFGPVLADGLAQDFEVQWFGEDQAGMLAAEGLGRTDLEQWRRQSIAVARLMQEAAPESQAIGEKWVEDRVQTAIAGGADPVQARETYVTARAGGVLKIDFVLFERDGRAFTVADIHKNPDYYHGLTIRDPIEPDYGAGDCARIYCKGQDHFATVNSMAHGGAKYRLEEDIQAVFGAMVPANYPELKLAASAAGGFAALPAARPELKLVSTRDEKPLIQMAAGALVENAKQAEQFLIAMDTAFFVRAGLLVRPVREAQIDSKGRETRVSTLVEVGPAALRNTLGEAIAWEKYLKTDQAWVKADPSKEVVESMLARRGDWGWRPISGVISAPTLRPDGSILSAPGYDAATKLYISDSVALPPMPEHPTFADGLAALAELESLLVEFPFTDDESRSVALSALITPTVRGAMSVAPAHIARASTAGTGKSYLFDTAAAIALGGNCSVMSAARTEDETEKRLGAKALAGHLIINIDNVNGELGGDNLCQLISQPLCDIRILGASIMPTIVNKHCIFATGNNIRLVGDMTRRAIVCSMDAVMERPEERTFRGNPVAAVLADRGRYIAACMTIVRAYMAAGRPHQGLRPFNGFEDWSGLVRSALVWLGKVDPCKTVTKARDEDPQLMQLAQFLSAMREEIGSGLDNAHGARRLYELAQMGQPRGGFATPNCAPKPQLYEALNAWVANGNFNLRSFGKWVASVKGRVVDGYRVASVMDKHAKVQVYFVEPVA